MRRKMEWSSRPFYTCLPEGPSARTLSCDHLHRILQENKPRVLSGRLPTGLHDKAPVLLRRVISDSLAALAGAWRNTGFWKGVHALHLHEGSLGLQPTGIHPGAIAQLLAIHELLTISTTHISELRTAYTDVYSCALCNH